MKRVLLTSGLIFTLIIIGTVIATLYAKGYRFVPNGGKALLEGTGLLVLTSRPDGARVYINNNLTTATNNTINLPPGEYEIKIEKDGYFPWSKKVSIRKEIVREANATLFPSAPKLEAATITGASNPLIDPSGTFIAYTTASSSATKNGIYVLDMNAQPLLTIGGISNQIADNSQVNFSQSTLEFSPEGDQLLATVSNGFTPLYYLLSARNFNQNPRNVTATVQITRAEWDEVLADKEKKMLDALPRKVRPFTQTHFKDPLVSPDGDKIFYTASSSASLPIVKTPRWMSVNSTPEDRELKEGQHYVYDIKEDRNYLVFDFKENAKFAWHPDSRHIIFVKDKKISIAEYDGENSTILYAGPFVEESVFPWPDGSSIAILTNLNIPDAPYNLYRLSLK